MGLCCIQFMTKRARSRNGLGALPVFAVFGWFGFGIGSVFHSSPAPQGFQNFSAISIRQLPCRRSVYPNAVKPATRQKRMHSLLSKLRSLLEASWALSPTMVGLACVTLDLAALLHLRAKAAQPAAAQMVRQRDARE